MNENNNSGVEKYIADLSELGFSTCIPIELMDHIRDHPDKISLVRDKSPRDDREGTDSLYFAVLIPCDMTHIRSEANKLEAQPLAYPWQSWAELSVNNPVDSEGKPVSHGEGDVILIDAWVNEDGKLEPDLDDGFYDIVNGEIANDLYPPAEPEFVERAIETEPLRREGPYLLVENDKELCDALMAKYPVLKAKYPDLEDYYEGVKEIVADEPNKESEMSAADIFDSDKLTEDILRDHLADYYGAVSSKEIDADEPNKESEMPAADEISAADIFDSDKLTEGISRDQSALDNITYNGLAGKAFMQDGEAYKAAEAAQAEQSAEKTDDGMSL